jgi:hypothetical protein
MLHCQSVRQITDQSRMRSSSLADYRLKKWRGRFLPSQSAMGNRKSAILRATKSMRSESSY